jgi:CheY-like chemotaxis protein
MTGQESASGRPVVLVADDDREIRSLFSTVLSAAGFEVVEAVDGADALARLAAMDISLLLLDTSMPQGYRFGKPAPAAKWRAP